MRLNYINITLQAIIIIIDAIHLLLKMVQIYLFMTEKMNLIKIIYLYVKIIVYIKNIISL